LKASQPLAAFRTIHQRDVIREIRKRLRTFPYLRTSVSSVGGFSFGGGGWDIDFVLLGPDLEKLSFYTEDSAKNLPNWESSMRIQH
jgi:hypothetical protein